MMNQYACVKRGQRGGFTLLEVVLVISLLSVLSAVAIVAINPARELAKSRDTERKVAVFTILSAMHAYASDHMEVFIKSDEMEICKTNTSDCDGLYDLSYLTANQKYLVQIPTDPRCGDSDADFCTEHGSGYYISISDGGMVTITSPGAEVTGPITHTQ